MTAPAIERFDEPAAFLSAAEASLLRDEARNNLVLGLAQRLGQPPPLGVAEAYVVRGEEGAPVAVAVRSERRGLVVSDGPADALAALADEIVDAGVALPAANGPEPAVGAFVARYCERTGRDGIANLDFYFAYNFFRLAAILQGIIGRVRDGTATNENAADMERQVLPLAQTAWGFAERAGAR